MVTKSGQFLEQIPTLSPDAGRSQRYENAVKFERITFLNAILVFKDGRKLCSSRVDLLIRKPLLFEYKIYLFRVLFYRGQPKISEGWP